MKINKTNDQFRGLSNLIRREKSKLLGKDVEKKLKLSETEKKTIEAFQRSQENR